MCTVRRFTNIYSQSESVSILLKKLKVVLQNMQMGGDGSNLSCIDINLNAGPALTLQL